MRMGNSKREFARARRWWSARVMVSEPEGHDGFVYRALVRECLHVNHIPVCDRVDSHKAGPAIDIGQRRDDPLHHVKCRFRRRWIAEVHTVKLWTVCNASSVLKYRRLSIH